MHPSHYEKILGASGGARKIIRSPKVEERTATSRVTIWRGVRAGTFPAPVSLGANSIGWYEDEIGRSHRY